MNLLLEDRIPRPAAADPATVEVSERAERRSLLHQVARLESELTQLVCSERPAGGEHAGRRRSRGARLLSVAELEAVRERLARELAEMRRGVASQADAQEHARRRIEQMMLEPEKHPWARVAHEDIGEPGCRHWHVRPRFGLLGMLLKWWRVRISSGCP